MKKKKLRQICAMLCILMLCCAGVVGCGKKKKEEAKQPQDSSQSTSSGTNIQLTILGTSDVHDYLMNYDYYTLSETEKNGLVKISSLIKQYRKDDGNVLVFDNGDLLQGNPLGDYYARVKPMISGDEHPVYRALFIAGYDAATLGNHEFNYGLDYLHQIIKDSRVPIINTNIYNAKTKKPEFQQYEILKREVTDEDGNVKELKIGVLGFVAPQILEWDKINLEGKIEVKDIVESAKEIVPKVKEKGADVIVALAHSGYGNGEYVSGNENVAYELTKVEGIDAVIGGHAHDTFPSDSFLEDHDRLTDVNVENGTMNGIPTVEPGKYAEGVGVIHLTLSSQDNQYKVTDGTSEYVSAENAGNDAELVDALKKIHEEVITYVSSPVGKTDKDINTYFALVSDNDAVQLISDAQLEYAKKKVKEEASLTKDKDLPILSAAAPFKAGLSKDGTKADDYVEVKAGDLSIKDIANIYKYPNTAVIMKVNGKELRNWLDMCAGIYNTIDSVSTENQELLNKSYPAFNFDTIDGVTYEIDVTKPAKYDADGDIVNQDSSRIVNLKYNGTDIKDGDEFLIITNNYRASGGGNFPIFDRGDEVLYISSDETRQILADYVKEKGTVDITADQNWKLKKSETKGKVTFLSSTSAEKFSKAYPYLSIDEQLKENLTQYVYDLGKE